MSRAALASAAASLSWLAACATPAPIAAAGADAGAATEMRVLVKLARPSEDAAAIAEQVAAAAGTRARYIAATSPRWHALALACGDAAACDAALRRLGESRALIETVQRDERRRIVTP